MTSFGPAYNLGGSTQEETVIEQPVEMIEETPLLEGLPELRQMTMQHAMANYDPVGTVANEEFGEVLIMTPRGGADQYLDTMMDGDDRVQMAEPSIATEKGSSATRWRRVEGADEYNSKLQGQAGLMVYEKMRRGDASVRSSLRLAKTPVNGARWHIQAGDPQDPESVEQAEYIEWALFHGMSTSWSEITTEALLMLDFGYWFFEQVFQLVEWRGKERWSWKKWGSRHPMDVIEWKYDEHGGPESVRIMGWESEHPGVVLEIEKLLVFSFDKEAGNLEGISLLRSVYKHWYFKDNLYKIDAIQKERHGIGVPMIKLPINFTPKDKLIATAMGKNLRTNEMAHIVLPPNWEVSFVKVEGQPVDVMKSIEHHDSQIWANVLGHFFKDSGEGGSSEQAINIFLRASRVIADIIADVINLHAIPQLIDFNWSGVEKYPVLKVRRIGDTVDQRVLSFAMRNLVGANIIRADDKMEDWARNEFELPAADPSTARELPAKGDGQAAGSPRQGKPSTKTGQGSQGDRSGG